MTSDLKRTRLVQFSKNIWRGIELINPLPGEERLPSCLVSPFFNSVRKEKKRKEEKRKEEKREEKQKRRKEWNKEEVENKTIFLEASRVAATMASSCLTRLEAWREPAGYRQSNAAWVNSTWCPGRHWRTTGCPPCPPPAADWGATARALAASAKQKAKAPVARRSVSSSWWSESLAERTLSKHVPARPYFLLGINPPTTLDCWRVVIVFVVCLCSVYLIWFSV